MEFQVQHTTKSKLLNNISQRLEVRGQWNLGGGRFSLKFLKPQVTKVNTMPFLRSLWRAIE